MSVTTSGDWAALDAELDAWSAAGRSADIWWRDDDATVPTPALERLLEIRRATGIPIAIAVIPARAQATLAERLARERDVVCWQHGWSHMNHAPIGAPKAELGPQRDPAFVLGELTRGWLALDRALGAGNWTHVLVPPHNRIAPALVEALPQAGYAGLSGGMTARPAGVRRIVNTHVDIMNWSTRAFAGEGPSLGALVEALRAHRNGAADADEPIGFLTHHLAHDEAAWRFTADCLAHLQRHRAVRFRHPRDLFA